MVTDAKTYQMKLRNYIILFCLSLTTLSNVYSLDVGNSAPEILLKDTKGRDVTLSSLKGKVVLIDFWASWCHPCREANPFLIDAYLKFHHKGFEIVSISLDEDKSHWLGAIEHDKLLWETHVSDLKGWESKVVKDYGVEALPTSYLIDRDGKIVSVDPFAEDLELELNEIFVKEISFYPKNASNKLYFSLPIKYEIKDANGKKVLKGFDETVDISSLEQGLFSVKFGGKTEKFLKKGVAISKTKIANHTDELLTFSSEANYELHDSDGKLLKKGKAKSVDIKSLNIGEYFIHLNGHIEKFVKK